MSFLEATCDTCGSFSSHVNNVVLRHYVVSDQAIVVMVCPTCYSSIYRETNRPMMLALVAAGIEISLWDSFRVSIPQSPLTEELCDRFSRDLLETEDLVSSVQNFENHRD